MSNAYTSGLTESTTAVEFIMLCARAIGMLMNEPEDAPIVECLEPCTNARDQLEEARSELVKLNLMTSEQIEAEMKLFFDRAEKEYKEEVQRKTRLRLVYERMQTMIQVWQPPTKDHESLRSFMLEQLQAAIRNDCSSEAPIACLDRATSWLNERSEFLARRAAYWAMKWEEEQRRTAKRNLWLKQLRESLPTS